MRSAVATARGIVDQSPGAIPFFAACAALAKAIADPALAGSRGAAEEIRTKLNSAQSRHARQNADRKFRLKALAARFFVPPHQHSGVARCPLCRARLSTPEQQALAAELAGLRKDALEAGRKLEDVCRALETDLLRRLPEHLRRHWDVLSAMEPGTGYADAMRERFCEAGQFRRILPGLVESTRIRVRERFCRDSHSPHSALWQTNPSPPGNCVSSCIASTESWRWFCGGQGIAMLSVALGQRLPVHG